jgi:hypothetical protein
MTVFHPAPKRLRIVSTGTLACDIATAARVAARDQTAPGAIDGVRSVKVPQPSTQGPAAACASAPGWHVKRPADGARVPPAVVHQVAFQQAAAGARLQPAGQLDLSDELVVPVDVDVGQVELG